MKRKLQKSPKPAPATMTPPPPETPATGHPDAKSAARGAPGTVRDILAGRLGWRFQDDRHLHLWTLYCTEKDARERVREAIGELEQTYDAATATGAWPAAFMLGNVEAAASTLAQKVKPLARAECTRTFLQAIRVIDRADRAGRTDHPLRIEARILAFLGRVAKAWRAGLPRLVILLMEARSDPAKREGVEALFNFIGEIEREPPLSFIGGAKEEKCLARAKGFRHLLFEDARRSRDALDTDCVLQAYALALELWQWAATEGVASAPLREWARQLSNPRRKGARNLDAFQEFALCVDEESGMTDRVRRELRRLKGRQQARRHRERRRDAAK